MDFGNSISKQEIRRLCILIAVLAFVFILESLFPAQFAIRAAADKNAPLVKSSSEDKSDQLASNDKLKETRPPQLIGLSFDGSRSIDVWRNTLAFSREMKAKGTPIKFTYFISGVYFLDNQNKDLYINPMGEKGASLIGFADNADDIAERIAQINIALNDGNEIGSHANGHFDGGKWTFEQWKDELTSFESILFNVNKNNPGLGSVKLNLKKSDLVGFRAPVLGINRGALKALKELGYKYDASSISDGKEWPHKSDGLWQFPLATIYIGKDQRSTLSMDYNIFTEQTQANDTVKKGTPAWDIMYNDVYNAYMDYFNRNYMSNRAPIFIGHHFSLWNDGVYWEAMKNFAKTVCSKPEVSCMTYADIANYLDELPPRAIDEYNRGKFK